VCQKDLEGIVGKWKHGPYLDGPKPQYELDQGAEPQPFEAGRP
jgi:hypothetical protein